MRRCLELALKGLGHVAPNPMVGAVLVHQDRIVAEGYHERYGQAHAEVNALKHLDDPSLLHACTLYVNLEPCSHHGKTPPCADLIIEKGIRHVVIGNVDTNPLVGGKGIAKLQAAGIRVEHGILDKECRELNKRFFTFHEKKRPYIILKWAQTADGFISRDPLPARREDNWITGAESKILVHQWRSEEQAILVGKRTVLADDPQLTTRHVQGPNPLRMIIDPAMELNSTAAVFDEQARTLVFTIRNETPVPHVNYCRLDASLPILPQVLQELHRRGIASILVEGGLHTLQSFIAEQLWDEARVFVNPHLNFEEGLPAPTLDFSHVTPVSSGDDLLYIFKPSVV